MDGAGAGFRRRDHNSSEAIAAILHPNDGYREQLQRRGITPKDFIRQNKLQVKRLQARNREQREREAAAQREPFKLSRFKHARPRVSNQEAGKAEADANPVLSNQTQQEGEEAAEVRRMRRRFERVHVKAPVPSLRELEEREAALAELKKKEKVDFINTNAWEVINKSPRKLGDDAYRKDRTRHPSYGRIPKYLLDRKELWAQEEEERRLNAPDPDCPPGMVLLDEEERQRTLRVLAASLEEARARMNRLPLRVETLSQVRRKNELEEKLHEIEDAIKVFDRTKVYVAKPPTIDEQQGDKSKLKSRLRRNSTAGSVRSRVSAAA